MKTRAKTTPVETKNVHMTVQDVIAAANAYANRNHAIVNSTVMGRVCARLQGQATNATTGESQLAKEVTPDDVVRILYNALLHPTWR